MTDKDIIDHSRADSLPTRGDELMRIIARFEYALKESDYGKAGYNGEAEVDWDKFANQSLKACFLEKVRSDRIAPTILTKPASKQIIEGTSLAWKDTALPKNVQDLMGAVRRIRNNLVHGGKSGDRDSDRNDELVSEAIEVLLEALRADAAVRDMFEGKW
jgi:hypothetical protein